MKTILTAAIIALSTTCFAQDPMQNTIIQWASAYGEYSQIKIRDANTSKAATTTEINNLSTRTQLFSQPVVNYLNTNGLRSNEVANLYNYVCDVNTSNSALLTASVTSIRSATIDQGIGVGLFVFGDYMSAINAFQLSVRHSQNAESSLMQAYMQCMTADMALTMLGQILGN